MSALLNRVEPLVPLRLSMVVGGVVALGAPVLALLLGYVTADLISAQATEGISGTPVGAMIEQPVRLSPWLPDFNSLLPDELSRLARVSALLVVALLLLLLLSLALFLFYRMVQRAAVEFEIALIARLREQAKRQAAIRTLSAQQTALTDCLDYHLPRVRSALSRWWRAYPRHVIQFVLCVGVAFLIQPTLGLQTLTATVLVVLCFRMLDRLRRKNLPVVRERAAQHREALVALSLQGPLLESVHDTAAIEKRFEDQLSHYRQDAVRSLTSSSWRSPALLLVAGGLVCLFLFVIAVQVLRSETSFSVPAALTFSLCLAAAAVSAQRLFRCWRDLQSVESATDELEQFLALPVEEFDNKQLKSIAAVSRQVELEHVTVQDSRGRKLLENVSVGFKPGMLVGVLASGRLQSRALVELLMGFGRPVSGRLLFDGVDVTDLKPENIARCAHWVASDGALVAGTVQDNLLQPNARRSGSDLNQALSQAGLSELIDQLPDGLATLISPADDRLFGDGAFRLALARAALTKASMYVIEEPSAHYDVALEQQTFDAMHSLVGPAAFTIVLPQRLLTLRHCDLIIMLHDHAVVDTGTHAELLQRQELYRHLNYQRFNPFRGMAE
ncbi:MAG: ABC transporter ATP-binding protein [Aureliella sp.]